MNRKVLLMILDGWGIGDGSKSDVISSVKPAYLTEMNTRWPHATLRTDGAHVGLPDGQMGNSEVGHLNIGAGRVVYQDLVKINLACQADDSDPMSLAHNAEVRALFDYVRREGVNLHFMGLLSDGGVHAAQEHLERFLTLAKTEGLSDRTFVHAFMDGRDTDPKSGLSYVQRLEDKISSGQCGGMLVSMVGRYYAMDRDKRWDRIKQAYDLLLHGIGQQTQNMVQAIENSYSAGVTDEFLLPVARTDAQGQVLGRVNARDAVVFLNFRNDRAKELTMVLTQEAIEGMKPVPLYYVTMTPYDAKFQGLRVLFPKENVHNTIGQWIAQAGLKQLRIAETEKYAHVTFFLNGGREETFEGEERILVPSPKVATYDLQPEMSAYEVTQQLVGRLQTGVFDFICLNFANGDMVGHTGVYEAIEKAVLAVDQCVHAVVEAAIAAGYEVVQIADHGNADNAVNADGSPNTAHSLNPVPIVVVSDRVASVRDGVLADVAPTVLDLMGIEPPKEMTGHSLVQFK